MLRDLQKAFLECFYQRKETFLNSIQSTQNLSQQERFDIYGGSITEGFVKALRENYPVTEKLVGEEFFRLMSYNYIANNHSSSPNLGDYGVSFADFVENFSPAKCLPYLADICRLEWRWQKAYYGMDYLPLDVNQLSKLNCDSQSLLVFKRCANSSLLKSDYPLKKIWDFNQTDDNNTIIDLKEEQNLLLIWRPDMEVIIEELTEAQWSILKAFDEGLTLGQLSDQLQEKIDLSTEIPQIVAKGWFSHFILK